MEIYKYFQFKIESDRLGQQSLLSAVSYAFTYTVESNRGDASENYQIEIAFCKYFILKIQIFSASRATLQTSKNTQSFCKT